MNESSDERAKEIRLNAEELGWKKRFRWPKSFSYDGVEYQNSGPIPGIDCDNLNEHIYHSGDERKDLIINRFRDGRGRWQVDPSFMVKLPDTDKVAKSRKRH